jgi:uncharacterized protein YigE (DUF2233 family)
MRWVPVRQSTLTLLVRWTSCTDAPVLLWPYFLATTRHQARRLNLASGYGSFYLKPNGVFVLSPSGARLVESSEYSSIQEPVTLATQSGPLLIHAGAINPILDPKGTSRFVRNGVGVVNANEVVFAITTEPVNFYEFAPLATAIISQGGS